MCGIVGIVNLDPRETVDEALLKRMRDVLRHRGPDGEGLWAEGPVGLGHRRLAIVRAAGGEQAVADEGEFRSLVSHGEIHNLAVRPALVRANAHRSLIRGETVPVPHPCEQEHGRSGGRQTRGSRRVGTGSYPSQRTTDEATSTLTLESCARGSTPPCPAIS